ncbi:MAG: helix-turn-helix transcriptional regulator [Clostridia bacterium]|nr:helix-turn-helix transcriptional regulator [Clostridia bacterium]
MSFSDKLKAARAAAGLSQHELAERAGIHYRTVQNWESGGRLPRSLDSVMRAAQVLGTTSEALLTETDQYIVEAAQKGGAAAARDVDSLVNEVIGLFAGGDIDEDEKDGIMAALNEAYWIAKQKNAKYTPKKYRKNRGDGE